MQPFSTYPEDRARLLSLAERVENTNLADEPDCAYELADLVKAILEDEEVAIDLALMPNAEFTTEIEFVDATKLGQEVEFS
jgi:hypothetical protein